MDEKVSIVIPVYNGRATIRRCIESIMAQTYANKEIIVVDDGSEDNFTDEIKGYLGDILVIRQENRGAAIARNTGFEAATGKYIMYIDSDDYVSDNYVERLLDTLKENHAQFCLSAVVYCDGERKTEWKRQLPKRIKGKQAIISCFLRKKIGVSVWGAIYLKSFLMENKIRFTPGRKSEDTEYKFKCCLYAKRVAFCNEAFYMVVNTTNSICNSYSEKFLDLFLVMEEIEKCLVETGCMGKLLRQWRYFYLSNVLWLLEYGTRFYKESKGAFIYKVKRKMKMSFWKYPFNYTKGWKEKAKILMLRVHPYFYCCAYYFRTVKKMAAGNNE